MLSTFQFPDIPKEAPLDELNASSNLLSSLSSLSSLNSFLDITQDVPTGGSATTETTGPGILLTTPTATTSAKHSTGPAPAPSGASMNPGAANLLNYSLTVDPLVQTDIEYAAASSSEASASARLLETVILHDTIDRLHSSLDAFYESLVTKSRTEPQKFTHAYHRAHDFYNSILKGGFGATSTEANNWNKDQFITTNILHAYQNGHPFLLNIKASHRDMINSFLGLVRDPGFVSSVLFTLTSEQIDRIIAPRSHDPFEDLAALNRTRPLDILFHSVFPSSTQLEQKTAYFSQICANLTEHKRCEQLCFAIFDKFMDQSGYPSASALEDILLTLLQEGTFLSMLGSEGSSHAHANSVPALATHQSSFGSGTTASVTSNDRSTTTETRTLKPSTKSSSISLASSMDETSEKKVSEFLQKSVNMLLEYFDNTSVESIPKVFIEFVQMTLEKVSIENREDASLFIVVKYIFNKYLHKILTTPEHLGILKDFYLDEDQRQKILVAVFDKMYKLIVSAAYYYNQSDQQVGIDKVKCHLDSILKRLTGKPDDKNEGPKASDKSNLSNSLIVLSPSDVVFLYQAFFPSSKRPHLNATVVTPSPIISSSPRTIQTVTEPRNSANYTLTSSFSLGASQPRVSGIGYSPSPQESCVGTSYVSTSTIHNDHPRGGLTGNDEFLHPGESFSLSTPVFGPAEDVEYDLSCIKRDVEPAVEELINRFPYLKFKDKAHYLYSLRPDKALQFRVPHPFVEQWQVFRINSSTNSISDIYETNILDSTLYDSASAVNTTPSDMYSTPSNSSLPQNSSRPLFEIIQKAVDKVVVEISSSPYNPSASGDYAKHTSSSPEYLYTLLSDALAKSMAKGQFLDSNDYSRALQCLEKLSPTRDDTNSGSLLLHDQMQYYINNCIISSLAKEKEKALKISKEKLVKSEKQMVPYKIRIDNALKRCEGTVAKINDFKVKIWYSTEIRTSSVWSRARDVAVMLTYPYTSLTKENSPTHGSGNPASVYNSLLRRNNSGSSMTSSGTGSHNGNNRSRSGAQDSGIIGGFSFRRFASFSSRRELHQRRQSIISVPQNATGMFAPKELGGELKLSDKESENTMKWLTGQQIQNFCCGEERIHRFCCEVDDLVKRVMGDTLTSCKNKGHSLLSSSPLFRNDLWKLILEVDGAYRTSSPNMVHQTSRAMGTTSAGSNVNSKRSSMFVQSSNLFVPTEAEPALFPRRKSTESVYSRRRGNSTSQVADSLPAIDLLSQEVSASALNASSSWNIPGMSDELRHRQNKSLSEVSESYEFERPEASYFPEEDLVSPESDSKRERIEEFVVNIQMRLISLIYTDIGIYCWYEGSETDKWLNSPIVLQSLELKERQYNKFGNAIAETPSLFLKDPPLGRMSESRSRDSIGGTANASMNTSVGDDTSSVCTVPPNFFGPGVTAGNTNVSSPVNHSQNIGNVGTAEPAVASLSLFNFDDAYRRILQRFSVNSSPMGKLTALHELELLVVSSLSNTALTTAYAATPGSTSSVGDRNRASKASFGSEAFVSNHRSSGSLSEQRSKVPVGGNVPVAGALTSLAEAIPSAEREAKRTSSIAGTGFSQQQRLLGPNTDMIAEELRRVLKSSDIKSHTLFRDLQFIASFVPPHVLDLTDMGKAFWDVSLAALSLKEETLNAVINSATEIFQYNTGMVTSLDSDELEFVSSYGLSDCAQLWKIGVKEGDPVSQRELAIMLMSHPDIASVCLPPFTRMSQVFEPTILDDPRQLEDLDKYDPIRMSVVKHLMGNAAFYGDEIATEYLQQSVYKGASVI